MARTEILVLGILVSMAGAWCPAPMAAQSPALSAGRAPDSTQKSISELRAAEHRRIPLEVALKASSRYKVNDPVQVTVMVTNLFDKPLLLNRRLLVNHPRLEGEVSFRVEGPDGRRFEIQRLVTPMTVAQDDFVLLPRGQSVQRTVDLLDLYGMSKKGVYKITVFYHNDLDQPRSGLRAWKGVVASEPVEVRID